jgi:cob(I)alamin adenosyltransferase
MKIYTKGGDKGKTSLLGGARKLKSDIRIQAYGTVDELNSHVGLLADQLVNQGRVDFLRAIQTELFAIGSYLASDPDQQHKLLPKVNNDAVDQLESAIDEMDSQLPQLRSFVLPGGHQSVSFCHIARCVCRRAERKVVALNEEQDVDLWILEYLNRLSDYLFVLSRMMATELEVDEIPWIPNS